MCLCVLLPICTLWEESFTFVGSHLLNILYMQVLNFWILSGLTLFLVILLHSSITYVVEIHLYIFFSNFLAWIYVMSYGRCILTFIKELFSLLHWSVYKHRGCDQVTPHSTILKPLAFPFKSAYSIMALYAIPCNSAHLMLVLCLLPSSQPSLLTFCSLLCAVTKLEKHFPLLTRWRPTYGWLVKYFLSFVLENYTNTCCSPNVGLWWQVWDCGNSQVLKKRILKLISCFNAYMPALSCRCE